MALLGGQRVCALVGDSGKSNNKARVDGGTMSFKITKPNLNFKSPVKVEVVVSDIATTATK